MEVLVDGIAIWSRPGEEVARSPEDARELLRLVVACYALVSRMPLDLTFDGWVEATHADFDGTVVGFNVDTRGHKANIAPTGRKSQHMRAAVELAAATHHRGPWRLAVRDVYSALLAERERSDDAYVFAYRAIEDLAWACSPTKAKDWPSLHTLLGTTKSQFMARTKNLRLARDCIAHGEALTGTTEQSDQRRKRLVDQSRRIVIEAIRNEPTLPNLPR